MNAIKKIKYILIASILLVIGCEEEDKAFGDIVIPGNVAISAEIIGVDTENVNGDGSGFVLFTVSADNAITYEFDFGDEKSEIVPSGSVTHRFSEPGLNTYSVQVIASGTGGVKTSNAIEVTVFSSFDDPIAKSFLSGASYDEENGVFTENSSKVWYWSASESGHLGLGPSTEGIDGDWWYPKWYIASAFEKDNLLDPESTENSKCIYTDELTFTVTDGELTYELNSNGGTYFNASYVDVAGGSASEDYCYDFDVSGVKIVSLAPAGSGVPLDQTTDTAISFSDNGFMGYYIGTSTYEILSITENKMVVRGIMGNNPDLAWYHTFTTTKPVQEVDEPGSFESIYTNEIWSDEFNTDGAPDASNWTYDLGTGDNGWGNGEAQSYTNDASNVLIEGGFLKITAKAENGGYTSARIKSEGLFDFTYGRVEARAKLPTGGGTWPAIWMLGSDYLTNTWPNCGEMDIMEHVGNRQNEIFSTLHYTGRSGGNGVTDSIVIDDVSDAFHTYTIDWSPDEIVFLVDDTVYHTIENNSSLPFDSDFFLILNVAMGGGFGGDIDPAFTESTMEIDYIRVYQ
ncbi:hypothetical protein GCM10022393_19450 [Aquimarina addita]|uniref:GH16 domain-containing protein n=1 Tax=Aquimarina addita TaxID=870485 RepID=A0ABP6UKK8_9FLAO